MNNIAWFGSTFLKKMNKITNVWLRYAFWNLVTLSTWWYWRHSPFYGGPSTALHRVKWWNVKIPFHPPPELGRGGGGGLGGEGGARVEWFLKKKKLNTYHVVPNRYRTSIPKFHFKMWLFSLEQGLWGGQNISKKTCLKPVPAGGNAFFDFLEAENV